MRLITDAPSGSPEWHAARKLGIGASEAAAAIGISPWESPHELWATKTGLMGDKPASLQMEAGTALEPLIAKLFERHTGLTLHRSPGVYQSEESPFMLASPDGLIEQDSQAGAEFKNTSRDMSDGLPLEWQVQAQQQMYVMGWAIVHFGVFVNCRDFQVHHVERDDSVIAEMVDREAEFWRCVELRKPPEFDFTKPGALDAVKIVFRKLTEGQSVVLSPSVTAAWAYVEQMSEEIKTREAVRDRYRAEVLAALGDAEFGVADGLKLKRIKVKGGPVSYVRDEHIQLRKVKA